MDIWCFGGGSIGLLMAAKLALAGKRVSLITHSDEQAASIMKHGLTLVTDGYEQKVAPYAAQSAASLVNRTLGKDMSRPDWIFLTVKQQHLTDAFFEQLGVLYGGARVLSFQNGIGHIERLLRIIPGHLLDAAVTTEGARRETPIAVHHTGHGLTRIGSAVPITDAEHAIQAVTEQKMLVHLLKEAGFESFLSNNMKEIAWNKLLMNAVINPLTAILNVRNGELLESENLFPLMRSLYEEGVQAAEAEHVHIQDDLWEQLLEVCRKTANNASSMLQDVLAGRITEIEWMNGALLKSARMQSIPMPTHETVYRLVKALEKR